MKNTVVSILQQRMDKRTNEQFWAVATLTGMNAFLIIQMGGLSATFPSWLLLAIVSLATIYGLYFVADRHVNYYKLQAMQAELLGKEQDIPGYLRTPRRAWKGRSLSGVVFYEAWILGTGLMTVSVIL